MISFFEEPSEVVEYLSKKRPKIHFNYDEIMHDTHKRVFTIAKITKMDLLIDIKTSLEDAYRHGKNFEDWKKEIKPLLKKNGWYGKTTVVDPKTKEAKDIFVGSRRLKTIFDTNMRTSYAKARYDSQMNSLGGYFRYVAVLDRKTRPEHKNMHGITLPKTDKFWDKNYPPNGWGCRCKVQVLDDLELKEYGIKPLQNSKGLINIADKDFAYNPGKFDKINEILKEKKDKFLNAFKGKILKDKISNFEHEKNIYVWEKGLNNAVDEILIKKNKKSPIKAFALGRLSKDVILKSEKILKTKIETKHIMSDKHGILHIRPERKGGYGQALRIDEIRQIVRVLNDDKTPVSVDINDNALIFWFDDEVDKTRINKLVVDLNYKLKKFGLTNYMVTAGKIKKNEMNQKHFIKIR